MIDPGREDEMTPYELVVVGMHEAAERVEIEGAPHCHPSLTPVGPAGWWACQRPEAPYDSTRVVVAVGCARCMIYLDAVCRTDPDTPMKYHHGDGRTEGETAAEAAEFVRRDLADLGVDVPIGGRR